ncbi:MAG: hypothetical protein Q8M24_11070 [Pseudolabrys sp.]|nr:hypothetical protein [Pseudolabrys sp.]
MRVATGMPTGAAVLAAGSIAQMDCRVDIGKSTLVSTVRIADQGKVSVKSQPMPCF